MTRGNSIQAVFNEFIDDLPDDLLEGGINDETGRGLVRRPGALFRLDMQSVSTPPPVAFHTPLM